MRQICRSCQREVDPGEMDDFGWCGGCRAELRRRSSRRAHAVAVLVTVPFAAWIVFSGEFGVLPAWAWLLPLAVAYYLGFRIGRELLRGYLGWRGLRQGAGADAAAEPGEGPRLAEPGKNGE